jgi:hypothetical protein
MVRERQMSKLMWVLVVVVVVVIGVGAWSQRGKVLDMTADEVTQKFSTASCEELKAKKGEPPTMIKKVALSMLHDDPDARKSFIDKVAAPVLNKMVQCGMAP